MAFTGPAEPEIDYDARFKEFDAHPLFMRDVPADLSSNDRLEALQSLIYDDTPDNVAGGFKQEGNDYFRGKRYREALGFYSQAINAKPDDKSLLESLLLNRAACNLELQNYGATLRDCASVITTNPKASKAYFRSARALVALERFDDAIDCCQRALAFDPNNASLKATLADAQAKAESRRKLLAEKERKAKKAREEKQLLELACKARHLTFINTPAPDKPGFPSFDTEEPRPYTPTTQIMFPVFLVYPQHSTSDFISHFAEHTTFKDQLAAVFPEGGQTANWDKNREYHASNLAVYVITRLQRLLKVGGKMTLADVFLRAGAVVEQGGKQVQDGLELRDGCLSFVVVPKGVVETWYIEDFKQKKAKGAGGSAAAP